MNDARLPATVSQLQQQMSARSEALQALLPKGIGLEFFQRTVLTVVARNPKLLNADRASLLLACMDCARDGLIPDGREAALIEYKGFVRYTPMIGGFFKKVRQSGAVSTWDIYVVHREDDFSFSLGDEPKIEHRPALDNPGPWFAVYSIVRLRDGGVSREVMSRAAVERIRDRSDAWRAFKNGKIKSTPWSTDEEAMAQKTVARKHAKRLPMNREIERVLSHDDRFFDEQPEQLGKPRKKGALPPPEELDEPSQDQGEEENDSYLLPDEKETETESADATDDPKADFEAGAQAYRDGDNNCRDAAISADKDRMQRWQSGWLAERTKEERAKAS